jgi:ABC-type lipopolysaccharide export system ATPase subunit
MSVLEADGIRLEFKTKVVLSSIYVKVETGTIIGVLGRNGYGKSCLFNIIYGTLNVTDQSIRIDGISLKNGYTKPHLLRYLPQFHFFPTNLTIETIFRNFHISLNDFCNHFPEVGNKCNDRLGNLSGGEKRLIEVYTIVKSNTKFVLLDEPFSNLMPLHVEKVKQIITTENSNKGFLITDHLYQNCMDICNDLYVLKDGKTNFIQKLSDIEELGYIKIGTYTQ